MMLNDTVFFIADGNASFTESMAYTLCDLIDWDGVVGLIRQDRTALEEAVA
jgi:peroxiredoxin